MWIKAEGIRKQKQNNIYTRRKEVHKTQILKSLEQFLYGIKERVRKYAYRKNKENILIIHSAKHKTYIYKFTANGQRLLKNSQSKNPEFLVLSKHITHF